MKPSDIAVAIIEGNSYMQLERSICRPLISIQETCSRISSLRRLGVCKEYALIGGCAVMVHLHDAGLNWFQYRSSPDVDIIASDRPIHRSLKNEPQLNHSRLCHVDGQDGVVDWLLVDGPQTSLRKATLSTAKLSPTGLMVASVPSLIALKLSIPSRLLRPKDILDIRLLTTLCSVTRDRIREFLKGTVAETQLSIMLSHHDKIMNTSCKSAA